MRKSKSSYAEAGRLHVIGRADIPVAPDIARLNLGVVTQASTAQQAVEQNAALASQVIDAILALKIPRSDIQTIGLSVFPVYRYDRDREPELVGFRAENTVSAVVPVALAGAVFDRAFAAGANIASGISFGLREVQPYREAALRAAVQVAQEEACVISEAFAVALGAPVEIHVEPEFRPVFRELRAQAAADVLTPVEPGEIMVAAQVRVVYLFC